MAKMSMLKVDNKIIAVKALMTGKWVEKGTCDNVNLKKLSSSSHSLDKDTLNGQVISTPHMGKSAPK